MRTKPFFLPKGYALRGGASLYCDEIGFSEEKGILEEAVKARENLGREQDLTDIVISLITHYVERQKLWWQASWDVEQHTLAEIKFQELAAKWRKETKHTSSLTRIILHPAYQKIIGMGPVAIKFILQELQQKPLHWFWALESITGENPVQPEDDFDQAVEAWLQWGREHGFL
jgi:hypothetical protein